MIYTWCVPSHIVGSWNILNSERNAASIQYDRTFYWQMKQYATEQFSSVVNRGIAFIPFDKLLSVLPHWMYVHRCSLVETCDLVSQNLIDAPESCNSVVSIWSNFRVQSNSNPRHHAWTALCVFLHNTNSHVSFSMSPLCSCWAVTPDGNHLRSWVSLLRTVTALMGLCWIPMVCRAISVAWVNPFRWCYRRIWWSWRGVVILGQSGTDVSVVVSKS